MWEWLAAATGVELGKLVLEQVLNLGKAALEDYVKDFFKDCIHSGVARAEAGRLKQPMAEAVGYFIKRFIKELQINDVPETRIEHHYNAVIKQFVRDKAVLPILGKAFEKDCQQIDYVQLQRIWTQNYQDARWQFPTEEFAWRRVAKEYVLEVKGIVKANGELRSLLETELLEDIARNTAQISPGFDVVKYRDSLQCSYGYLKLYNLDSTDRVDAIKLWNMFVEQTVREALPPMRYELPLDLKRQLREQGKLEADLSPEALEHYRREYFQQPSQKVLEAVAESQQAVIVGDPGAGKSTLLQYLALGWVEGNTETLPLLIELREYAIAKVNNFLEFLHCGRGADWQFDRQQLHQHLLEHPTLVMFDGLDEVFDRATQSTILDDIIRFAHQYPKARVLVTSRIIGYNPERLQHSGFRHFTIQPLDADEIREFIDRWYDLAMGSDSDKLRLQRRLKDAIANSKAIQNLADNPLLLTMMAILNRRQELPRDRADLYDQASRVLLYHWDVDCKRLQLPMDAIGRREKQEMLRLVAYEMQEGEEGLKGNLISAERLTRVLTDYLRDQGFSEPREKANRLIQQLRERNFILCYRGADTYGFVHRTFLEYFCAVEIVNRFEKQRTLSFEQLRDEVFGGHWQDETWHEVLRLICGMIDVKFVGQLIEFLMSQEVDKAQFLAVHYEQEYLKEEGLGNLLFACDCFLEVKNTVQITSVSEKLLSRLKTEFEYPVIQLDFYAGRELIDRIFRFDSDHFNFLLYLQQLVQLSENSDIRFIAVNAIDNYYHDDVATLEYLQRLVQSSEHKDVRYAGVAVIGRKYRDDPGTFGYLQQLVQFSEYEEVRRKAINEIGEKYKNDPATFCYLQQLAQLSEHAKARSIAVDTIGKYYQDEPQSLELLWSVAQNDPFVRENEQQVNPRQTALHYLLSCYPTTYYKTLELLRDRATNDPDEQLREWAREQLKIQNEKSQIEDIQ